MTEPTLTQEQKLKVMALINDDGLTREEAIADVLGTTYVHAKEEEVIVEHVDARKKIPEMTKEKRQEFIKAGIMVEDEPVEIVESVGGTIIDEQPSQAVVPAVPHKQVIARQEAPQLTIDEIKKHICPAATDTEAYTFLKLCEARRLNPFTKEAYLLKYGGQAATIVVGKDAFTRRAEEHPMFDGYEAGIIVEGKDGIERRDGTFKLKDEVLLGGWAKVHRKDRKMQFVSEVSMTEYSTGKSSWQKMPATMIRKVALVQALREAFPSDLGGCYDSSEMGAEI